MGIDLSKLIFEPHLDKRLAASAEKARKIVNDPPDTDEAMEMQLRMILSDHWGKPFFDPYFDRPIDELALEVAIIIERRNKAQETSQEKGSEAVLKNLDEAAAYASDGWEDVPAPLSDAEKEKVKNFMETDEFPK